MIGMDSLNSKTSHLKWLSHVLPIFVALVALAMVVLAPFWAVRYYQQPFMGILLEPNNIVIKINGKSWPASQAGVVWPEQLTTVNGTTVANVLQVNAILAQNGDAPLQLEFIQENNALFDITVSPVQMRLDGIRQRSTILFADISGFTFISESIQPEVLFRVLNYYLSMAAQAILEEEGTLDKFVGDAVMALWNAPDPQPDHALRALHAVLAIQKGSLEAHKRLTDPAHHLRFRIGIATGEVMVGSVRTNELYNYTAIGDTVNLAQRLETTARPDQILIDQATYLIVAEKVNALLLDPVQIKGKAQPVSIYTLESLK
jgi:class 3 adenylate cyclase